MRYGFVILLSMGFLFNICYADEKLELKDQKNKESYSLGYQFGQTLKVQGLNINLDAYVSGIKDFLDGKPPAMSQEEIRATVLEVQKRLIATREKELKEMAERNIGPSLAFL